MMILSFGLGECILVNVIISLPIFQKWQLGHDISESQVLSKVHDTVFYLPFQLTTSGLLEHVKFKEENFGRPVRPNSYGRLLIT